MVAEARPLALLEREPALEALASALGEAAAGEGRVALVYGEAGIGKTSLVDHFTRARAGSAHPRRHRPAHNKGTHTLNACPVLR
jgi:Cdc6-like AAA superfamily ATPase